MSPPKIDLSGGGLTVTNTWNDFRISDVGACRLLDVTTIAPAGSLSDPQFRLSQHLLGCIWGQKGHIWLEQSLTLGGTFRFIHSGAAGSVALNNALFVHPFKELTISFNFLFTGTLDSASGWNGSIRFNGEMKGTSPKTGLVGIGFQF